MSMLSAQCDELRDKALLFEGYNNGEISRMLREAADTIETLREKLQAATLGSGECECESSLLWDCYHGRDFYEHRLSCGHIVTSDFGEPPNYCEECGAKVRKAVKR